MKLLRSPFFYCALAGIGYMVMGAFYDAEIQTKGNFIWRLLQFLPMCILIFVLLSALYVAVLMVINGAIFLIKKVFKF